MEEDYFKTHLEELGDTDDITINYTWKDALRTKTVQFNDPFFAGSTLGYKIIFVLWSWDIFYGQIPFVKSMLLANILVWLLT